MNLKNNTLTVRNITKVYDVGNQKIKALNNVSFEVSSGEFVAIMGTSGSGKSTLLNILGALDKQSSGDILLNNKLVNEYFKEPQASYYRKENIGFIFQAYHLFKDLTVEENLSIPLIIQGIDKGIIKTRVLELIKLVNLEAWKEHLPINLSGGQKQRVAIARALITNPNIVLADEPTGNLDYNTSKEVLQLLLTIRSKFSSSIILVTHDPMVASYADRVLFFHNGTIVQSHNNLTENNNIESLIGKMKSIMVEEK